jgi:hypothetical protein
MNSELVYTATIAIKINESVETHSNFESPRSRVSTQIFELKNKSGKLLYFMAAKISKFQFL